MAGDSVGRAVIEVVASTEGLKAGIGDAKSQLTQLKEAARDAGESLNAGSTKFLQTLEKQARALEVSAATFGMSKVEASAYGAALMGVSGTAAQMVDRIAASQQALKDQAKAAALAAEETARLAAAQAAPGNYVASLEQQAGALERQSRLFGMTRAQIAAFEAAELGASAAATEFIGRIRAADLALEGQAKAARDAAAAAQALAAAQRVPTDYLASLQRQAEALTFTAATFGKTESEIAAFKAQQLGVAASATAMVSSLQAAEASLNAQKTAAQAAATAAAELKAAQAIPGNYLISLEQQAVALEKQSALFGKSRAEIAAYEAAQLGVSSAATGFVSRLEAADVALERQAVAAKAAATAAAELKAAQAIPGDYIRSLEQQAKALEFEAQTFGKTRAEIAEFKAAQLGVASGASTMVARIRDAENALNAEKVAAKAAAEAAQVLANAQRNTTISAGQLSNALRQTPAQFTDIFVSIASGQQPLTVLLQQGGQLKDMFGGVGNAMRGIGTYVLGLINPLTIAAAAAVTLGYAFFKGSQESKALNDALVVTGNYAGTTSAQLQDMARAMAKTSGTQTAASEALALLAGSGKIASAQFKALAQAAIDFERATGTAIKDSVENYVKLSDEPAKASAKLNETMHYLTQATYERIDALEKQGDKETAAALATATYAAAQDKAAKEIMANLGYMEKRWQELKDAIKETKDALLSIGRPDTNESKAVALEARIKNLRDANKLSEKDFPGSHTPESVILGLQTEVDLLRDKGKIVAATAAAEGKNADLQRAAIEAGKEINRLDEERMTKAQKMNKELTETKRRFDLIREANPNVATRTPEVLAQLAKEEGLMANIRAKYKESPAPKFRDDAATKMIEKLNEQTAALRLQLTVETPLLESEKERAKFAALIASLKGKTLTDEQKSLLAGKDAVKAALDRKVAAEQEVGFEKEIARIQKQSDADHKKFLESVASLDTTMATSAAGRKEQYDSRLEAFGKGSQALEESNTRVKTIKEYNAYYKTLEDAARRSGEIIGDYQSKEYKDEVEAIRKKLDEQLQLNDDYYASLKEKQGDWTLGAMQALNDYNDKTRNVFKSTKDAADKAFQGMEDALVAFAHGGSLHFGKLVDSILSDLLRIQVQKSITGPLSAALQGLFTGGGAVQSGGFEAGGVFSAYMPQHATGLDYVPRDNYVAMLHQGERVQTAAQARRDDQGGGTKITIENHGARIEKQDDGQGNIRLIIDAAVAEVDKRIASGGGSTAQALKSRGLNLSGNLPRRA